jgi:hypothetical protein
MQNDPFQGQFSFPIATAKSTIAIAMTPATNGTV